MPGRKKQPQEPDPWNPDLAAKDLLDALLGDTELQDGDIDVTKEHLIAAFDEGYSAAEYDANTNKEKD